MKKIVFLLSFSFTFFIFVPHHGISAEENNISLNEIMSNPEGSDLDYEWVELYNSSPIDVFLDECILNEKLFTPGTIIYANSYLIVAKDLLDKDSDGQSFEERYGNHSSIWGDADEEMYSAVEMSLQLKNSEGSLELHCPSFKEVVTWDTAISGQSLSKDEDGEWTEEYQITPGRKNETIPPIIYLHSVIISEVYSSPIITNEETEWLELYNYGNKGIDLSEWTLKDTTKKQKFGMKMIIKPHTHLVLDDEDLSITLNNTGDHIELVDPNGKTIDTFTYIKTSKGLSNIREWRNGGYRKKIFQSQKATPRKRNIFIDPNDLFYDVKKINISVIRVQIPKEKVIIQGIVTADKQLLGKNIFYLQDDTGGIQIYISNSEGFDFSSLLTGTEVKIVGKLKESNGELKMTIEDKNSLQILSSKHVVNPLSVAIDSLGEELEGRLVVVSGKINSTSGRTFYISGNRSEIKVLIKSSTHIQTPKKKKGQFAAVIGILSQYGLTEDGKPSFRILPRYDSDIVISDSPISLNTLLARTGDEMVLFIIFGVSIHGILFLYLKKYY